jgi:hypothetical protein
MKHERTLVSDLQRVEAFTESGLGGTRTLNQRLKRALLYH